MSPQSRRSRRSFRSLSAQFLLAGGVVMAIAAYVVGLWVSNRIEKGVVQSSGASAALYIESLIPNQVLGRADDAGITDQARTALREVFRDGILSERVVTYNVWSARGEILDSSRDDLRGRVYPPSDALLAAWSGEVVAQFQNIQVEAEHPGSILGVPLLEVYVPIRDGRTGQVVAVVEFYQRAEDLAAELAQARRDSWIVILQVFGISGALLFGIVHAGSRLIERQRHQVDLQLEESRLLTRHNETLRKRVAKAAQRSTAQSEKIMQRIGQDLHDGVAQHLSLASLRLEGAGLGPSPDAETVSHSILVAMKELRAISRGLALPDLASLSLSDCARQAVDDHNKSYGASAVFTDATGGQLSVPFATKLCVYRFVQEALANASRHAQATDIRVRLSSRGGELDVTVRDDGIGFDASTAPGLRDEGGQGLPGLSDRAETLGGRVDIASRPGAGTRIALFLPLAEVLT
ncbi:sensor histidine kinase [Maribius pontilimi]|uniref:Oxygen sensor histidine kinase NreB n=1 Tax=Palleronia pontilimi TaxID=1964209 RepID=A0A934IG00_9RHOB|nr:sensor histidine kinase [Palleronia pontilimi]MBJ3762101.1 sensor histidine kinase [Palleronia pontilimi]